jgi:hypothetical protein
MGFFSRWLAHELQRDAWLRQQHHAQQKMPEAWNLLAESQRQLDEARRLLDRAGRVLERGEVPEGHTRREEGFYESTIRSCLQCGFPLPLAHIPSTCPYCHRERPRQA